MKPFICSLKFNLWMLLKISLIWWVITIQAIGLVLIRQQAGTWTNDDQDWWCLMNWTSFIHGGGMTDNSYTCIIMTGIIQFYFFLHSAQKELTQGQGQAFPTARFAVHSELYCSEILQHWSCKLSSNSIKWSVALQEIYQIHNCKGKIVSYYPMKPWRKCGGRGYFKVQYLLSCRRGAVGWYIEGTMFAQSNRGSDGTDHNTRFSFEIKALSIAEENQTNQLDT